MICATTQVTEEESSFEEKSQTYTTLPVTEKQTEVWSKKSNPKREQRDNKKTSLADPISEYQEFPE